MARRDIDVVIYDNVVTAMSQPGGVVWKWALQKSQRTRTTARRLCPVRTGRLRSTVDSFYEGSTRDQVKVGVSAGGPGAPYAQYVIFGTATTGYDDWIYPRRAFALGPLPVSAAHPRQYRARVSGQDPNDFLSRALEEVMATL